MTTDPYCSNDPLPNIQKFQSVMDYIVAYVITLPGIYLILRYLKD